MPYIAVHIPTVASFNTAFVENLSHGSDADSELFVDIHLPEQATVREALLAGEESLEYGPTTPYVVASYIRFSGDDILRAEELDDIERDLSEDFRVLDADFERTHLHPFILQAIENGVIEKVLISKDNSFDDLYLVYEIG